jgi:hypothetical protein
VVRVRSDAVLRLFFDGYDASAPSVEWVFI